MTLVLDWHQSKMFPKSVSYWAYNPAKPDGVYTVYGSMERQVGKIWRLSYKASEDHDPQWLGTFGDKEEAMKACEESIDPLILLAVEGGLARDRREG